MGELRAIRTNMPRFEAQLEGEGVDACIDELAQFGKHRGGEALRLVAETIMWKAATFFAAMDLMRMETDEDAQLLVKTRDEGTRIEAAYMRGKGRRTVEPIPPFWLHPSRFLPVHVVLFQPKQMRRECRHAVCCRWVSNTFRQSGHDEFEPDCLLKRRRGGVL